MIYCLRLEGLGLVPRGQMHRAFQLEIR
jgi:hypothetical protein